MERIYKINDYVMYKREVCKIKSIKEKYYKDKDYYELIPVSDESLKIVVPKDSNILKRLLTKEEVEALINKIPSIPIIKCDNRMLWIKFKELIVSEDYEDLLKIIKTAYIRNRKQNNHKKSWDKDNQYVLKAENYLYQEFAIVLHMSVDEVREYVVNKILMVSD